MDYLGEDGYAAPPAPQQTSPPAQNHSQPQTPDPHTPINPPLPPSPSFIADPNDPYNGMPPPPEATYADLPSLMRACQDHGRTHGYACVTSSNNYKRGIAYVRCDRGGEYVNHWNVTPETRVRKNRTRRLVGCRWKARAKRNAQGEWQLSMMEDKHSGHGPSGDLSAHPSLRQLPDEAVEEAKEAFEGGKTPKEVLESLRRWNGVVTPQDVYNLKAKISRRDAAVKGGTPVRGARLRATRTSEGVVGEGQVDVGGNGVVSANMGMNGYVQGPAGEGNVDPALRGNIEHLTAAVAQMKEADEAGRAGQAAVEGKCTCNCCEH